MMGNIYTHKAPAWLAALAGIAFFAVPPLSAAQNGKETMVAMAQAPSPESSTTQGHSTVQSGTGPTVPQPCGEQAAQPGSRQGDTPQGGGKAAPACVDTPDSSEDKGTPRSVGAPDQNGLPGAGAAAGAGGSIDERSR